MDGEQAYVGEILVRHGIVDRDKLAELTSTAEERGLQIADVLVRTGAAEEEDVIKALADEMGMPFEAKLDQDIPETLLEEVPIGFARQHHLLPLREESGQVVVAVADPLDPFSLDDLRARLGRPVVPVASTSEAIDDLINRVYERKDAADLGDKEEEEADELEDLLDATDEAPVIRFVNNLFYTAQQERASDIHVEPTDDNVVVRYRIDGRLVQRKTAPKGALQSIVARIKIEAGLNIAEKRLPQDGRITKKIRGKVVDVRVSTIPTAKGERVVMRLLDKANIQLDLMALGFARRELNIWSQLVERPNGILLVTGPTGSGKTTTLYGSLNRINTPDQNILTAEDPVEYALRGIGQLQVHAKIGLTFAAALRSFLRQDPDVIMVGEIRDHETAELAIQASLTGHLVLSTLHTNDAPGAITRLVDMKVQPFQISSTVLGVLAQRLVRRLCPVCRQPYTATMEDLIELGLETDHLTETLSDLRKAAATTVLGKSEPPPPAPAAPTETESGGMPTFYKPVGCEACNHTGYKGRLGIFELMLVDDAVRRAILDGSDAKTIQKVARGQGMRVLREDGARQVIAGVTSVEEVLAATQAIDIDTEGEAAE